MTKSTFELKLDFIYSRYKFPCQKKDYGYGEYI